MDKTLTKLIVIAGPTATGKSDAAIALAKQINGEIISADSMQVYKGMDIGTAKMPMVERQGVRHHLIDILDPHDDFNVYIFKKLANAAINDITSRGRIPILVGGTGFYIQAVTRNIDFTENETDTDFRNEMMELAKDKGNEAVYELLKKIDPDAAAEIHPNNIKRVIRALEYARLTGDNISRHNNEQRLKETPYDLHYFVLNRDRQRLYQSIDRRVDKMFKEGLVDEVEHLVRTGLTGENVSMKGIGYREFFPYFRGEITLNEVKEQIKLDTRHFAKRQVTWFKREASTMWIDVEKFGHPKDIAEYIYGEIQ